MCAIFALAADELARRCDPAEIPSAPGADAPEDEGYLGQDLAVDAVRFGVRVRHDGYHLFALGPPGVGKRTMLLRMLRREAEHRRSSEDWCYVYNFQDPRRPRALALPAGRAAALRADMEHTVSELQVAMRAAFEGEEYRARKQKLVRELKDRRTRSFESLEREAREQGVTISHEEDLFTVAPLRNGAAMSSAEFERLPQAQREQLKAALGRMEDALDGMLQQFNDWDREHREALQALERATAAAVGARVFGHVRAKYVDQAAVLAYLSEVEANLAESVDEFVEREPPEGEPPGRPAPPPPETSDGSSFHLRASVNVLVDHAGAQAAPVIYEDNPTYANLIGRVEHASQFGSLIADFSLIKPGALHRARGGYLLVEAHRLLDNSPAWEALKRTLRSAEIRLDAAGREQDSPPTVSPEPDPIPLADTKVVLLGDRDVYDVLTDTDPEFLELFKVLVDFEDRMDRTADSQRRYAKLLARLAHEEGLRQFTPAGTARVIDHAVRLAEDVEKISICVRPILDLMREADCTADLRGSDRVDREHVQSAIEGQLMRAGRARQRLLEDVRHGLLLIDTSGEKTGQVNGLTVVRSGEHSFGLVARITATTWVGKGEVIDIEREVELGGPVHSKGVLILAGFLGSRYAREMPLSLSASLVFEQSYAAVEGDSASLAEACALLSALSDMPARQSVAITGSINQHGEVQAIGGVNEKIEGFFEVCLERGLTGVEGVVIPNGNVRHLMLRDDVVAAVSAGKFHVWAVQSIDDALELVFGKKAGRRDDGGRFPEGTVNGEVEARLRRFAESSRRFLQGGADNRRN